MNPNTPEPWQAIGRVGDRPVEITDPEANIASEIALEDPDLRTTPRR